VLFRSCRQARRGLPTLTLAASALARKGAGEVAAVARAPGARVLILGSAPSDPAIWTGVARSLQGDAGGWLAQSDAVLLPARVEDQPRALRQALAAGLPVVASAACGLGPRQGLTVVEPGDTGRWRPPSKPRSPVGASTCRAWVVAAPHRRAASPLQTIRPSQLLEPPWHGPCCSLPACSKSAGPSA
jgi:hypothetical protein